MLLKARAGLVKEQRQVNRGGKTFTTTVWVRPKKERDGRNKMRMLTDKGQKLAKKLNGVPRAELVQMAKDRGLGGGFSPSKGWEHKEDLSTIKFHIASHDAGFLNELKGAIADMHGDKQNDPKQVKEQFDKIIPPKLQGKYKSEIKYIVKKFAESGEELPSKKELLESALDSEISLIEDGGYDSWASDSMINRYNNETADYDELIDNATKRATRAMKTINEDNIDFIMMELENWEG